MLLRARQRLWSLFGAVLLSASELANPKGYAGRIPSAHTIIIHIRERIHVRQSGPRRKGMRAAIRDRQMR